MKIEIELPDGVTIGDLTTVAGSLVKASTEFIDWELLHLEADDVRDYGSKIQESVEPTPAIRKPGVVLLDIARQLERVAR